METVVFIIISIGLVSFGIYIQIRKFNQYHPKAEFLIRIFQNLGFHPDGSATGDTSDGKN